MSTNPTPVELKPCAWCNGPAVNVGGDYITCGAAWNPGCAGHMVRTDAETWNDRPPASAAPGDELVERINRHADVLEGIPRTAGLVADMCQAANQLTIYARRVAELAWQPIETAPHAMHVLAARFDDSWGEWIMGVVMSPPTTPYTHWMPLPPPPATEGDSQ